MKGDSHKNRRFFTSLIYLHFNISNDGLTPHIFFRLKIELSNVFEWSKFGSKFGNLTYLTGYQSCCAWKRYVYLVGLWTCYSFNRFFFSHLQSSPWHVFPTVNKQRLPIFSPNKVWIHIKTDDFFTSLIYLHFNISNDGLIPHIFFRLKIELKIVFEWSKFGSKFGNLT